MVNTKVFALLVLIAVTLVVFGLTSLTGGTPAPVAAFNSEPAAAANIDPIAPAAVDPADPAAVDPADPAVIDPDAGGIVSHDHLPLMVRWSNWRPEFGPAYVYAREADMNGLLNLEGPVEKMIMVTSYEELQRLMRFAGELQASGVTTVGFNTENGAGMTPGDEMNTLKSADPDVNIVARAARLATSNGFDLIWGPVRHTVDDMSDAAVLSMIGAGVSGVAIQEQKFIETQPADARLAAVNRTRQRYLSLAERAGVEDFSFHVQIMQERCPNLENCVEFVEGLEAIPVDSIAIWSNGPIPVDFVNAIRMKPAGGMLPPS
ncbi:MAG: hypothetical protein ACK2U6_08830 [Candidatus Promineifilaceae bacterium]